MRISVSQQQQFIARIDHAGIYLTDLHNVQKQYQLYTFDTADIRKLYHVPAGKLNIILRPHQDYTVAYSVSTGVHLLDVQKQQLIYNSIYGDGNVTDLCWLSENVLAVSHTSMDSIRILDVRSAVCDVQSFSLYDSALYASCLKKPPGVRNNNNNSDELWSLHGGQVVCKWDLRNTLEPIRQIQHPASAIQDFAPMDDDRVIIAGWRNLSVYSQSDDADQYGPRSGIECGPLECLGVDTTADQNLDFVLYYDIKQKVFVRRFISDLDSIQTQSSSIEHLQPVDSIAIGNTSFVLLSDASLCKVQFELQEGATDYIEEEQDKEGRQSKSNLIQQEWFVNVVQRDAMRSIKTLFSQSVFTKVVKVQGVSINGPLLNVKLLIYSKVVLKKLTLTLDYDCIEHSKSQLSVFDYNGVIVEVPEHMRDFKDGPVEVLRLLLEHFCISPNSGVNNNRNALVLGQESPSMFTPAADVPAPRPLFAVFHPSGKCLLIKYQLQGGSGSCSPDKPQIRTFADHLSSRQYTHSPTQSSVSGDVKGVLSGSAESSLSLGGLDQLHIHPHRIYIFEDTRICGMSLQEASLYQAWSDDGQLAVAENNQLVKSKFQYIWRVLTQAIKLFYSDWRRSNVEVLLYTLVKSLLSQAESDIMHFALISCLFDQQNRKMCHKLMQKIVQAVERRNSLHIKAPVRERSDLKLVEKIPNFVRSLFIPLKDSDGDEIERIADREDMNPSGLSDFGKSMSFGNSQQDLRVNAVKDIQSQHASPKLNPVTSFKNSQGQFTSLDSLQVGASASSALQKDLNASRLRKTISVERLSSAQSNFPDGEDEVLNLQDKDVADQKGNQIQIVVGTELIKQRKRKQWTSKVGRSQVLTFDFKDSMKHSVKRSHKCSSYITTGQLFSEHFQSVFAVLDSGDDQQSVVFDKVDPFGILAEDLTFIKSRALEEDSPLCINLYSSIEQDYRFGQIQIELVDMNEDDQIERDGTDADEASDGEIQFVSGHTELSYGVLHLYKDTVSSNITQVNDITLQSWQLLCVLAVPAFMTTSDFLLFVSSFQQYISHYRVIRDSQPNRYMVLMKFKQKGMQFMQEYQGRQFSILSAETCHVVRVKEIDEFTHQQSLLLSPDSFQSPYLIQSTSKQQKISDIEQTLDQNFKDQASLQQPQPRQFQQVQRQEATPPPVVELPTCPVCLERMDASISGLVTVLCHHTFHCHCLTKWSDSTCPVCRFSIMHIDQLGGGGASGSSFNVCSQCNTQSNLWICLICGHLGCGRYHSAHAYEHFTLTNHVYALELETQRVWDYVGDGYVHRLIRDRSDGKVVELPAPLNSNNNLDMMMLDGSQAAGVSAAAAEQMKLSSQNYMHQVKKAEDKMDRMTFEFTQLLTTSLESQRAFYEQQLLDVENERDSAIAHYLHIEKDLTSTMQLNQQLESAVQLMEQHIENLKSQIQESVNSRAQQDKQIQELQMQIIKLKDKFKEELLMNEQLRSNQKIFTDKIQNLEQILRQKDIQIQDLNDQVFDLMAYFDAQQKVQHKLDTAKTEEERQEIVSGNLVVQQNPQSSQQQSSSKNRKKSRKQ
ncbi:hypothetical protein MIR68_003125 [Amoeboaphelidium protococcarum]|nr:hypothetical protein MIR68_003125 [Amoeboaphelidium protococcarum]